MWVGDAPVPANVRRATQERWELRPARAGQPLGPQLSEVSLAIICANGQASNPRTVSKLLGELGRTSAVAVFLLPDQADEAWRGLTHGSGQFLCVRSGVPAAELSAKLAAAAELQPVIRSFHSELAAARDRDTAGSFDELDEEMRLAARLQRDFLPRRLPEVGDVRFGVLYRPASWVSGDIYDIVRLDETHVGFYVADAVGHGMPAALLTMFIKKALQTKRVYGNSYELVAPDVSLAQLNEDICRQNLSSCQFCTVVYCLLDTSTLSLTYAQAGHPPPILIHADGSSEPLTAPGTLLGVFPAEKFPARQVQLRKNDRLLLYSDGAEGVLQCGSGGRGQELEQTLRAWQGISREEML
ncbi:MAG: SpoIIE family protein phosphatase, partial [Planctomycetota bacterium]|nr:SpoIIE family protein phosphatase [Planctomycetota bacterium]